MRLQATSALMLLSIAPMLAASSGCSEDSSSPNGTGGTATGGTNIGGSTGGTPVTGGSSSGGAATGGVTTGGISSGGSTSGGLSAVGGSSTGGSSTGGSSAGSTASGGTATAGAGGTPAGGAGAGGTAGGTPSSGGSTGKDGGWGEVENPGADCTVGAMPSFDSLMANPKLPDPFKKMDGTRITTKSEWRCRREEILRQAFAFIYGDKPATDPADVSGTVSNSSISVQVKGPKGNAMFDLTVSMNGATAPAPAIIYYDGGLGSPLPIPSGVASIKFTAVEASGGSGAKTGPFYTAYGSDHPAGYLVAQAWQISRVLDLLEKNPGTIDPKRIGLTGCSRNGKGAFVGGVLDNRIALTMPVESGLGGTVALRLVEVLDANNGGPEWPYHGISYVRWLSEVALGKFTSGNGAGSDNTDKLPVDMHEMMGLIAPRGLFIADNPSTMYNGLDRNSAWVTAEAGKRIFEALGVGDAFSYQGASGSHCSWRTAYDASLKPMIDKFLKGDTSAKTGNFATDLPNKPAVTSHVDWEVPTLSGEL